MKIVGTVVRHSTNWDRPKRRPRLPAVGNSALEDGGGDGQRGHGQAAGSTQALGMAVAQGKVEVREMVVAQGTVGGQEMVGAQGTAQTLVLAAE